MLIRSQYIDRYKILKSQMSLFGHDHHIAYTRTNKYGTVSQIKQKGAAPVHEQGTLDFNAPPEPEVPKSQKEYVPKSVDHKQLIASGKSFVDALAAEYNGDGYKIREAILDHFRSKHDIKDCQKRVSRIVKNSSGHTLPTRGQQEDMAEALQVIGVKSIPTLKYAFQPIEAVARAFAGDNSVVMRASAATTTVWHEVAHHIEKSHKEIGRAAKRFVLGRAEKKNGKPVIEKLKTLTQKTGYGDKEVAVKDKFINPYTGKIYGDKYHTEVLSMGVQYLATRTEFIRLYKEDPEHLHFVIGVLHHLNGKA